VANFPFIANVSGLDLKAVAGSNTATPATNDEGIAVELQKPTVTASFTLSTYFVKPEERLQELVI
jgi:hypothetical protein